MSLDARITSHFSTSIQVKRESQAVLLDPLSKAIGLMSKSLDSKHKIMACGNGGSAAIANHYLCDYLKLLRTNTTLKPIVTSLSSSVELITAISNDIKWDYF